MISSAQFEREVSDTLEAILATEISPELIPAAEGEKPQSTEAKVGPCALQDFNLYYTLRYGFRPSKIAFMAMQAWEDAGRGDWPPGFPESRRVAYSLAEIRFTGCSNFYTGSSRRSQFKRSALAEWPESDRLADRCRHGVTGARRRMAMPAHGLPSWARNDARS